MIYFSNRALDARLWSFEFYARYDLSFPVHLSKQLILDFKRYEIPHQVTVLPCGHYTTGKVPFKWLDGYTLVQFLRRTL